MRLALCTVLGIGCVLLAEGSAKAQNLSTYGTPGLVDMPTAEMLPDGDLAMTGAVFRDTARGTVTFQMLPWVYGSFRYSYLRGFDGGGTGSRYDRSFDIHFRLREETRHGPAIGVGLRDFGGTGVYSGEYVVLTKTFAERWKLTGGMGWGRLGERNSFRNPLSYIDSRFETRPPNDFGTGGKFSTDQWFRGPAALFGGVEYKVNDQLSLLAEYSSDTYSTETARMGFDADFPVNLGLTYRFENGANINAYYMYGSTLGLQFSYVLDPRKPAVPGGLDKAPPMLQPVDRVALASWNLPGRDARDPTLREVLRARLEQQGLRMVGYDIEGGRATVEIENGRYNAAAQAVGRTARIMANTLPPEVEAFGITLLRNGLPITSVETHRDALYELENDLDGSWRTLARSEIRDADERPVGIIEDAYPYTTYRFGPYARLSFFDPDDPVRYEIGAAFVGDLILRPGVLLSGLTRLPFVSTLDDTTRVSDSVLPHVRSDWALYAQQSDLQVNYLTANYLWRPGPDLFARFTAGYLEEMYGGLSAELLWYPGDERLALGAEVNYARQRDFDMLFGFQDYDIVTGHASMYYDFDGDYHLRVDAGRYLAGDWGATFTIDREFNNGFKVGAFATFTNVSSEEFGEGSFDKGIRFEIPVAWLTGRSTLPKIRQTIRPVLRDGGARLQVENRLYDYVRDERAGRLVGQWGRFYR
ncbi:YjbH domain-containing protein [Ruegeria sediminis]|uniref:YjbH domain-containing protein n=1 Tax=Ruegeria sediminis TaxID=2583820 RepID=A0ABY2WV00_9RHOB|nr:YjbH domain-containing protein [Ruegeria sediminis]TMV05609.1 YjbH domain-containing protein [Ruegeria sediminis]